MDDDATFEIVVRRRRLDLYQVTRAELNEFRRESLLAAILFASASGLFGAALSASSYQPLYGWLAAGAVVAAILVGVLADSRIRKLDKQHQTPVGDEDDTAGAPPDVEAIGPGFRVLSATYGATERTPSKVEAREADVTKAVAGMVSGRQLRFIVDNNTLGGDPYPNVRKSLSIRYADDGQVVERVFAEGDAVDLP